MKYLFTLSLLLLFSINSFAYRSIFGQNSTEWYIGYVTCFFTTDSDTFYIKKDTVVNGLQYKKTSNKKLGHYHTNGLLREDTVSGKVWYKSLNEHSDSTEKLLFDFSLQKGDTFDMGGSNYFNPLQDSLKTVDTVYYKSGLKYIQFKPCPGKPDSPFLMIEGVGGTYSIFWKETYDCYYLYGMACSFKDGVTTYGNCAPANINFEAKTASSVNIYPNPADYKLYISDRHDQVLNIEIFDMQGHVLKQYSNPREKEMDISNLPPGVYMAIIVLKDGQKLNRKFIINH